MQTKEKVTVISKEELLQLEGSILEKVLKIIFDNSEIEGSTKQYIKAYIPYSEEWIYIEELSKDIISVFISNENKNIDSKYFEHIKPFDWGKLDLITFRGFFEIYIIFFLKETGLN